MKKSKKQSAKHSKNHTRKIKGGGIINAVSKTMSNIKNKTKYLANLALDTSNVKKIHLKNQFYLQYMDLLTVKRVYSRYVTPTVILGMSVEEFIKSADRVEDRQLKIVKADFLFKYDIYASNDSKTKIEDLNMKIKSKNKSDSEKKFIRI
jgi:hypothetical protein